MNNSRQKLSGFTLIELLVVVAIIAILIAIAIPALSAARRNAKNTETRSELTALSTSIEAYYQVFNAYPGPAATLTSTVNLHATTDGTITGSQNLLLGLSYGMFTSGEAAATGGPAPSTLTSVSLVLTTNPSTPASTVIVDAASPSMVRDFGNTDSTGRYRTSQPFFGATSGEISPALVATPNTWPNGGVTTTVNTGWAFPTLLDRYQDPLPVLYFRKIPGVDGTGTSTDAAGKNINTSQKIAAPVGTTTAGYSYYLSENSPYISGTVTSPSGAALKQPGLDELTFAGAVSSVTPNGTTASLTARGGYVLMSAGYDRVYGKGISGSSDDIVIVGGN